MIRAGRRLAATELGTAAIEFALVAPTFLMFVFLILDGGRMMFIKQSLSEVAIATARCAAIKGSGCSDNTSAQTWAVNRGLARNNLKVTNATVVVIACNGVANMARATITATWQKGAMTLLPQSVAPSTFSSVACYPIAS